MYITGNTLLIFECLASKHFHFRDEETRMNSGYDMNNAPETAYVYVYVSPSSVHWEGDSLLP